MSNRISYTFTVLRYVHDIVNAEFVNVGVVLHAPEKKFLGARMSSKYGRITRFFPGTDGENVRRVMTQIERSVKQAAARLEGLFPENGRTAVDFATLVLPHDDSSLQWAPLGSGQTRDPALELDRLYEQFVARYERPPAEDTRTHHPTQDQACSGTPL